MGKLKLILYYQNIHPCRPSWDMELALENPLGFQYTVVNVLLNYVHSSDRPIHRVRIFTICRVYHCLPWMPEIKVVTIEKEHKTYS